MRLTMCLLRKRKMRQKPQSFIRSWQWNNSWYLNQERRIYDRWQWKSALEERNIPIYKPEEILSPVHTIEEEEHDFEFTETALKAAEKDETHPLWQDQEVYNYNRKSWLPKDKALVTASSITNSVLIPHLPESIPVSTPCDTTEARLSTLLKNAYVGDAVQKKLPKNWKVPFIGWHPVESVMRPRNQYDWKAFSWGRNMPREYGVPNARRLFKLNSSLVKEMIVSEGLGGSTGMSVDQEVHRQFVRLPDGKVLRLYLEVPLSVNSSKPNVENISLSEVNNFKDIPIESVAPLSPLASLYKTNIYRNQSNHPITSLQHRQPYVNTVFDFYTSHIAPQWDPDTQQGRCLMHAFTAALGQARLRYGSELCGTLPKPVIVNVISTDGPRYVLASFQLNSLDFSSDVKNLFWSHPETLNLFQFCGYREAKVVIEGVDMDVYNMIHNVITKTN